MAQVWLVTGSSRGLGHAIVEAGLAAGNKVLATARDIKSLADLSERSGDQVKLFAMDVTDEAAAANAVMAAVDVFGSLDVVINNAGYGNLSSVEDTPRGVSKASPRCFRAKWHRSASRSPSLNPVAFAQTSRAVPPNLAKVILNTIRRLELPQDFSGTTTASSLVTPKRQLRRSSS